MEKAMKTKVNINKIKRSAVKIRPSPPAIQKKAIKKKMPRTHWPIIYNALATSGRMRLATIPTLMPTIAPARVTEAIKYLACESI
jgi:hypothetical protein